MRTASARSDEETTAPDRQAQLSKLVDSARASGMHVEVESEMDGAAALPANFGPRGNPGVLAKQAPGTGC